MPTLDWLTRRDDEQTAGRVPYRLLEPVAELSAGDPAAENMLIHDDNLDTLKALLPFYAGRVKCIYLLVVEYKGGLIAQMADTAEKRLIGEKWEKKSAGRGLFLIVEKRDPLGRGVYEQLQAKISGRTNP